MRYTLLTVVCLFSVLFSCDQKKDKSKDSIFSNSRINNIDKKIVDTTKLSLKHETTSTDKNIDSIAIVLKKMEDKKRLLETDYDKIISFIKFNKDESESEGVGYTIFIYLKNNEINNNDFSKYLFKKEESQKEELLKNLVQIMCIDIGEENYKYENFIKDFKIFENSFLAKKALIDCINNQVE